MIVKLFGTIVVTDVAPAFVDDGIVSLAPGDEGRRGFPVILSAEERRQRFARQLVSGRRQAAHLDQRRVQIHQADGLVHHPARALPIGRTYHQWNAGRLVPQGVLAPMQLFAQVEAVVAPQDDMGLSGVFARIERIDDPADPRLAAFRAALAGLLLDLAKLVVRDGEGARKFIEVEVTGAADDASAKRIAFAIANSPLVKTAVAGEDANWGRVVMAVGKSGEMADRDRLAIWFGDVRVAVDGERDPAYSEAAATAVMKREDIPVRVEIGLGKGRATVWTCDLTKEYVEINGDYRS